MSTSPLSDEPSVPYHAGLSELADRYQTFIVDLWGVLHDGVQAFPEAVDCMRRLKEAGKQLAILSNAPRRAGEVSARNQELGIAPDLAEVVMTSGEDTWLHLRDRPDAWYRGLGRHCYHLGPSRDEGIREGLDYDFVDDLEVCDFILHTGTRGADDSLARYRPLLEKARMLGLPMICANPDLEVIRGGFREICAGSVARHYEEIGGRVRYHGKPRADIYRRLLERLDLRDGGRIAAIGDSIRTDMAGATAAGLDGIFVANGIHGAQLGVDSDGVPDSARLQSFLSTAAAQPVAVLPRLQWG